jgi:hypothetical protein
VLRLVEGVAGIGVDADGWRVGQLALDGFVVLALAVFLVIFVNIIFVLEMRSTTTNQ